MQGSLDPEVTAVCMGLKPAVRVAVDPARRAETERRLRAAGLVVVPSRRGCMLGGRVQWLLYAAGRERLALKVRDTEEPILPGSPAVPAHERDERHRAMGRALGYPPCCVERFLVRLARGVGRLQPDGPVVATEDYVAAREAHVARAWWGLNTLRMREGAWLVGWYPCRFDCAVSTRYAELLLEHLARRHGPDAMLALRATLGVTVALAPDGGRALLTLASDGAVRASEPLPWQGVTAPECAGLRAQNDGALLPAKGEAAAAWSFDFTREAP